MKKVYPVILSGGSGTRLWPSSRKMFPKQFLPFDKNGSLFTKTLKRFDGRNFHKATLISNYIHRFLLKDSLEKSKIETDSILLEPSMKNTSAAVTLSTLYIFKKDPNAIYLEHGAGLWLSTPYENGKFNIFYNGFCSLAIS